MESPMSLEESKKKLTKMTFARKLLDQKSTLIHMKMIAAGEKIQKNLEEISEISNNAYMVLARLRFVNPIFPSFALENVPTEAPTSVIKKISDKHSIMTLIMNEQDPYPLAGLSLGGEQIQEAKNIFKQYTLLLIENANARNAFQTLDEEYKQNLRKLNVIDKILIPRLENTIDILKSKADDFEREDKYRIKKIKDKLNLKHSNLMDVDTIADQFRKFRRDSIAPETLHTPEFKSLLKNTKDRGELLKYVRQIIWGIFEH